MKMYCFRVMALASLLTMLVAPAARTAFAEPLATTSIPFTTVAPTVDGVLDSAWSSASPVAISNVFGTVDGTGDLNATFRALYDANNLYVIVEATDDVIVSNVGGSVWFEDGVEFYLDGDYSHNAGYGPNDMSLLVPIPTEIWTIGFSTARRPTNVAFASNRSGLTYRIEMRIAWSELGITPVAGNRIGLDIMVNDNDGGSVRQGKRMWSSTDDLGYLRTDNFGDAILGPRPNAPTATPVPLTATPRPPTATPVPPSATPRPPTATPVPPTATRVPATATPAAPEPTATATLTPPPSATPAPMATATARPTTIPGIRRVYLPAAHRPFDNYTRCTATVFSPPFRAIQPVDNAFIMYSMVTDRQAYLMTINGYRYTGDQTGSLLVYRVTRNDCALGGSRNVELATFFELRDNQDLVATWPGFIAGNEYLFVVFTRGGLSGQPFTFEVR
jgi:Carbohydrate family 9 binding domain-like